MEELKGGAWLYIHSKTEDNPEAKGVGFLIHPKFKNYVNDMNHHSKNSELYECLTKRQQAVLYYSSI